MSDAANRFAFTASDNINGIVLMIVARIMFAISDSFTKLTGEGVLPPTQVLSLRNMIALPIVLVMAWRLGGLGHIGTAARNPALLWRSAVEGVGLLAFVIALPHVTLGQSTVLLLTMPIILVALSALIFKEDVGWRRWTAILVGFAGVVLVAGPIGGTPNFYLVLTMVTAVTWAVRDLITSRIVGRIPSVTVTLFATLAGLVVSLPGAAVEDWQPVGTMDAVYLLAAGSFVAARQLSLHQRAPDRRGLGRGAVPLHRRDLGHPLRVPDLGRHSRSLGLCRHVLHHRVGPLHVLQGTRARQDRPAGGRRPSPANCAWPGRSLHRRGNSTDPPCACPAISCRCSRKPPPKPRS